MIKLCSWNVNGLRSLVKKGGVDLLRSLDADILCLQETRIAKEDHPELDLSKYKYCYWHEAEKKGYSGVATLSKAEPLSIAYDFQQASSNHPKEGRVLTLEFKEYFLVNVYTPNSQQELKRLDYRDKEWDTDFREYVVSLTKKKPVIACGDFNVAHEEIDIARPNSNRGTAGFTNEERKNFTQLLEAGFVDTFRKIHPGEKDRYSWWSYRQKARERNVGWRIDYFLVSEELASKIKDADILDQITGSDHAPVTLELKLC